MPQTAESCTKEQRDKADVLIAENMENHLEDLKVLMSSWVMHSSHPDLERLRWE